MDKEIVYCILCFFFIKKIDFCNIYRYTLFIYFCLLSLSYSCDSWRYIRNLAKWMDLYKSKKYKRTLSRTWGGDWPLYSLKHKTKSHKSSPIIHRIYVFVNKRIQLRQIIIWTLQYDISRLKIVCMKYYLSTAWNESYRTIQRCEINFLIPNVHHL